MVCRIRLPEQGAVADVSCESSCRSTCGLSDVRMSETIGPREAYLGDHRPAGAEAREIRQSARISLPSPYFLESVDRVLKVLDCFTPSAPELRLTDFSERLGAHKTQVLRILSTLERGGYVVRDANTKRYRLGLRLFELGMIVRQQMDVRRITHSYLCNLVASTQETARLVVPDDDGPVCVDLVESPKGIRVYAQLGMRMPWNAGTSPKLLLAYLPDEERERILARGGFQRFTERTITDPEALREEARTIRSRGYYVGVRDLDEEALGVSAPVFDSARRVVGAINVSGPASRLSDVEIRRLIALVTQAAADVSKQLGYRRDAGHFAGTEGLAREEHQR